jgi:chromosome segregation ATPase
MEQNNPRLGHNRFQNAIHELNKKVDELNKIVSEKDLNINSLSKNISDLQIELGYGQTNNQDFAFRNAELQKEITYLQERLYQNEHNNDEYLYKFQKDITDLNNQITNLQKTLSIKVDSERILQDKFNDMKTKYQASTNNFIDKSNELERCNQRLIGTEKELGLYKELYNSSIKEIELLKIELANHEIERNDFTTKINEKDLYIHELHKLYRNEKPVNEIPITTMSIKNSTPEIKRPGIKLSKR